MKEFHGNLGALLRRHRDRLSFPALLLQDYQAIGFVHGNISSENLSICGIGNGYDMFTFIDEYDINFKSNLVDKVGLYSLKNQKQSCRQECETIGQSIHLSHRAYSLSGSSLVSL